MNRRTREALMASIEKWEQVARGEMIDDGADNCPLCHEFQRTHECYCLGCPVSEATKYDLCERTPYALFVKAAGNRLDEVELFARAQIVERDMSVDEIELALDEAMLSVADTPHLRALASAEAAFLRSLLP